MVGVEGVDKVDRSTLAVDCAEADFRQFETARVLHTTTNEPIRIVQQVQGQDLKLGTRSSGDMIIGTRQTEARRVQR